MKAKSAPPSAPASRTPAATSAPNARRQWCQTVLGLSAAAVIPQAARLVIQQRDGWLLLESDR